MKKISLSIVFILNICLAFSQSNSFWIKQSSVKNAKVRQGKQSISNHLIYSLNLEGIKTAVTSAPKRLSKTVSSKTIIPFPNANGTFSDYRIFEASVMHPDLQAKYPDIRSYVGQNIKNPVETIRFSISPKGLSSMTLSVDKRSTFIEPYTEDLLYYRVYNRSERDATSDGFECEVTDNLNNTLNKGISGKAQKNANDGILRTYRLVVSATGEYTNYHGGTVAQALAAMNTTLTRVNGIYERDFNVTLQLIPNTDAVIYTNTATDPYGNTTSGYNTQLQNTLTSVIGEANYDVGHLFANLQNNGDAGCIGCVCVDNQKGSGWTSHTVPEGDPFDVDYVAHELGHQFGGNHTWTFAGNEGRNVQMEPGSGTTIMGYAGITGATDVQPNSDPYFHAISIQQITNYVKSTSCQTNTNTGNNIPVVNAGTNYTIPKSTPFVLEGTASDADAGDVLTYCWEQIDENDAATTYPSTNATTGVAFRSFNPTVNNKRYFPRLETIKTGATAWLWEAVPNVARNLNFRLTVRDNAVGAGANNSDDMLVTVSSTAGPFLVTTPNSNVAWNANSTQNISWDVAGTNANGINAATVDILLSTDGGDTYPVTLATAVPNNGSYNIVVPNAVGTQNRIMVKGTNHIFFDISNTNFTIEPELNCNATTPTGIFASNISNNSANLNWNAVSGASYDVQYRVLGTTTWTTISETGNATSVSGLTSNTTYEVRVRSKCPNASTSAYSTAINFTTTDTTISYCSSGSTNVNDEYIGRVQLNTINNSSGAQFYSNFTGISTTLSKSTQYTITVTPTWTGTTYSEAYAVWIDYNKDGDFDDAGEQIFAQSATTAPQVSGNFVVPATALATTTTMRVSMKYNALPTACETFTYGEVEDYTVIIEAGVDTTPPVITLNGNAVINLSVGQSYIEPGATATDNVDGDISNNIIIGGDTVNTNTPGSYTVTYNVSDSSGNAATQIVRTVNIVEAPANTVLNQGFFESGLDGWIDGGGDCARVLSSFSFEGNYSVRLRDNSGVASSMTLSNIDVSPYSEVEVNFYFYAFSMENNEDFWLRYFNGSTWTTVATYTSGININNDTFYTATVNLSASQYNFATNAGFRFQCDASGNNDEVYIDQVTITGITGTTRRNSEALVALGAQGRGISPSAAGNNKPQNIIYPNPVKDGILNVRILGSTSFSYRIVNTIGQQVAQGKSNGQINIQHMQAGMYFIEVKDDDEITIKKFIKE